MNFGISIPNPVDAAKDAAAQAEAEAKAQAQAVADQIAQQAADAAAQAQAEAEAVAAQAKAAAEAAARDAEAKAQAAIDAGKKQVIKLSSDAITKLVAPKLSSVSSKLFGGLPGTTGGKTGGQEARAPMTCAPGWLLAADGTNCVCPGRVDPTTNSCEPCPDGTVGTGFGVCTPLAPAKKNDNTSTYLMIGAGAFAIVLVAYLVTKGK